MKKQLLSFLVVFTITSLAWVYGQGLENFNNYVGTSGTYSDGTFIGQDGSTWIYSQCRRDRAIVDPSPCLGKGRNPTAKVVSGLLGNGCGTISFDYKQGFSSAVNLNVYVNGALVGNVTSPGGNGDTSTVRNSGPIAVNVPGSFTLMFKQADSLTSGQVTIDNINWTAFGGGPLPEPTNYPTNFAGNTAPFSVLLSWIDATGGQVPSSYLILGSDQNNIANPVDGTPVTNDPNLADGTGALNVIQGVQSATFGNLPSNKQYFFKIFPYTNSGTLINYKTDGSAPFVSVVTSNTVIIDSVHFTNYTMGNWQAKNVIGEQVWMVDSIHGVNGTPCIKMSGFANSVSNVNEDWFISKALNFNMYNNERLNFQSAYKYTGPALECLISNDYDGQGNPGDFAWTPLTATWSAGNWVWTPSGNINVSMVNGTAVYIGFKYTSTATESSTWELDDIIITGDVIIGLDESKSIEGFAIRPNPAAGECTLQFGTSADRTVELLSMTGVTLTRTATGNQSLTLDLEGFAPGLYFVRVSSGKYSKTEKLVIR